MSEETPKQNPSPPESDSPLLQAEDKGLGRLIVPGLLGVAGAALLYRSMTKNKKSSESSTPTLTAGAREVKFSKDFSKHTVGKDWKEIVFLPYLAEQAEENNLYTSDYLDGLGDIMGDQKEAFKIMMDESREKVLSAFMSTHKVSTDGGSVFISQLPDKNNVRKFKKWLDEEAKEFQESY